MPRNTPPHIWNVISIPQTAKRSRNKKSLRKEKTATITARAPLHFLEVGEKRHLINLTASYITPRNMPHKTEQNKSEAISFCERSIKSPPPYASDRLPNKPRFAIGFAS